MKYATLLIPVAALVILNSCSPKVSNGMASADSNASSVNSTPIEAKSTQSGKTTTTTTTSGSQQANVTTEIALPASK